MPLHARTTTFSAAALIALLLSLPAMAIDHLIELGGGYGFAFAPAQVFIAPGDTVTFRNGGGFHNVRSDAAGFRCADGCDDSGGDGDVSDAAWTFTRRFDHAGTFAFWCEPHGAPGSGMSGVITVEGTPLLGSGYTGTWYDPAQSGHGFFVEVLPNNKMLAYWFTFSPEGQQAWFGGVGDIVGNTAAIAVTRTTGTRFLPNFNSAEVVNSAWGTMTFSFSDCSNGRVDFASVAGFGSGSMVLKRLTLPAGLQCAPASALLLDD